MEDALRRSVERYRALVEATSQAVWTWSPEGANGDFEHTQLWWEEITGQTPVQQQACMTAWLDVVHPDDREAARTAWETALAKGTLYDIEYRIRAKDGEWRTIQARGIPIAGPNGLVREWVGTLNETTDKKAAERQASLAAAANAKFRNLFEQGTQFAGILSLDGTVVEANRLCLDACGFTRKDVIGMPFWECGWWNRSDALKDMVRSACGAASSGQSFRTESPYYVADGAERFVDLVIAPVTDEAGQVLFVSATGVDVTDRRRAENELRDIRSRMEAALAASAIGTWTWDVRADRFDADASLARLFSLKPEDISGAPIARVANAIHPDDRARIENLVARTLEKGSHYEADYRVIQADGSCRWVNARGQVERDAAGQPLRFPGVVIDITERKRAEEGMRVADSRAAALLESLNDGFVAFDREWRFTYLNSAYERMIGTRREDLIGRNHWEAFPATLGTLLEAEYRRVAAEGVTTEFENYYAPWERWFAIKAYPASNGISVQVRDVTAAKQAAGQLVRATAETERLRRLYEAVLSGTPDFVYVFSLDYRVVYANAALIKMWGLRPEQTMGKTFLEIGYEPWHAEMHCREIDQVRATKEPIRGEVPFNGTHGRRIYDYIFVPVIGVDGEVEAVAGTTRDVTERQAMEQELRDADRKKDDFIALLAHELRNPLAPIRNGLQVLRLADDRTTRERAQGMMDRQLNHMVRMIDDLLDVSRIGRNKMELRRGRVSLADVVSSAVETARPAIDDAGHDLNVTLPPHRVVLDADLTRLSQVFSNLLTNSAKYTPRGGRIWLSARRTPGEVVVSIRDTGIGIPPLSQPKIFDMFSQVDRSVERSAGGLGIGLALVKGLVEMHGGTVTVCSEGEGRGSTFTVTLPVVVESLDPSAAPAFDSSGSASTRRRVLVVDDNRDGADSLATMLELIGAHVVKAYDGLEAVREADRFRPEIVLMDVGMPRLNGLEATRQIREQPWASNIVIVALTGWGQGNDRERSREAGCNGHLVKPVSLTDLERLLAELDRGVERGLRT